MPRYVVAIFATELPKEREWVTEQGREQNESLLPRRVPGLPVYKLSGADHPFLFT